jgi:eukaryotic-like serine/threonine-protein kinase
VTGPPAQKADERNVIYRLRKVVREIHRRSVWQVLGVYVALSWAVLNAVDVLTGFAGLPDWTPTMALVLLMIGLPVVVATAFLQEGIPGLTADPHEEIHPDEVEGKSPDEVLVVPEAHPLYGSRVFTWRNFVLGGAMAVVLLVATVVTYFTMWAMGIGPVGSLVAQGVLDERDPILLAEFENRTDDASLGAIVTEALSVDLGESQAVTLLGRGVVSNTLRMMGRDPSEAVTETVAQEIAVRASVKAFVAGEVSRVGTRYLLVARIVIPETGGTIVSFRENATGDDDLLPAIDRLSARLREKMGESMRTIRLGAPLEHVTTSSLDALRKYTAAETLEAQGDYPAALRLLEGAVELDTAFAMAYRKIGVLRFNQGSAQADIDAAATLAYRYRHRLTELESRLAEANYFDTVVRDDDAVIKAYEAALVIDPNSGPALNNLALELRGRGRFEEALELLERAVSGPGASSVAHFNRALIRLSLGDFEGAVEARAEYEARYPGHIYVPWSRLQAAAWSGDRQEVHAVAQTMVDDGRTPSVQRQVPRFLLAADVYAGRVREAFGHVADAPEAWGLPVFGGLPGVALAPLGAPDIALWILDDTASVARRVSTVLDDIDFDRQPPASRLWEAPVVTLAEAGHVEAARALYERWSSEVAAESLVQANRDLAYAMILLGEGDAEGALESIERAAVAMRCTLCVERYAARIYEELGRTAEAIEIWERMRDTPTEPEMAPWSRIVAMKRLGPLYERVSDTANAVAAYEAFADAWSEADAELQPQLRAVRARVTALVGR